MFQPWMVWYGDTGITDLFIHDVEKAASEMQFIDAQIGHQQEAGSINEEYRRSKIKWIVREEYPHLVDVAWGFATSANKESFGVDITDLPSLQYTVYDGSNHGYYNWHADTFWTDPKPFDRKLSIIIQITDGKEYEGGNLELEDGLPMFDTNRFREKGSVIVFPSFYQHRVTPVTKGQRRSLVGWVDGPAWR